MRFGKRPANALLPLVLIWPVFIGMSALLRRLQYSRTFGHAGCQGGFDAAAYFFADP